MSRELKFRAWDSFVKKFKYGRKVVDHYTNCEAYTGLKDKNGKEIYEGDIIRDKVGYVYMVEWGRVMYLMSGLNSELCVPLNDVSFDEKVEIIGNIHENPELLGGGE